MRALVELGAAVNQAMVGWLEVSLGLVVCTHLTVCGCECCCGALACEGEWWVVADKGGEMRLTLCVAVYVECAVMMGRMSRAMMSCGSWVSRSLDVFVARMADVCDCVDRRLARPRCTSPVRTGMWRQ